jgi:hypothetical protein
MSDRRIHATSRTSATGRERAAGATSDRRLHATSWDPAARRDRAAGGMGDRRSLAFAALTVVWLLGLELLGVEAAVAYLAPALLILLPLLSGRYPGDEALVRVAGRLSRRARRRPPQAPPLRRRRAGALLPRGGRLVAFALAGRGPPLVLATRTHRFETSKEKR